MVKKIFSILNREFGINQAAFLLGLFALLSQILGLLRDRSLAHYLGPSSSLDIYYAAFRLPDFLYISIASLASVTVLIPFLIEKMNSPEDGESARKFMDDVFTVFLGMMVFVSAVLFFIMPAIARYIAPGFNAGQIAKMSSLSRVMLLSPIFLGLSNLFGTVTQMFKKFFVFALSPIFYNFGIILGVLVFYPAFGIYGVAAGVVLGALLHFAIQLPIVVHHGFTPHFSKSVDFKNIMRVVKVSLPRTLGMAANNLALLGIVALASFQSEGSISIFNFAFNLNSVPLGIIGVSYSVAAFPALAQFFKAENRQGFIEHMQVAARQIVFWSLPISFVFIVLRAQIVRVILGSGSFSWNDTKLTAAALALFSISILAQGMILLFVRAYYAAGDTKTPLTINFLCSVLIVALAFVFLKIFNAFPYFRYFLESLLRVSDIRGTEVLVLPLAYSLGTILNFILHWVYFKKDFLKGEQFLAKTFFQSLGASFIIGFVSYRALNLLTLVFNINTFWGILSQGLFAGLAGIASGVAVLYLMKSEELSALWKVIRSKFWKEDAEMLV
jgi:putative peptidoglycan lipid II flippase